MRVRIRYRRPGAVFIHPLQPAPKTAILAARFRETRAVRVFPAWGEAARRFAPESIAAPLDLLRELAAARVRIEIPHALIAFTHAPEEGLSDRDRELFWSAFGVPVFEQYLGPKNELLAAECEAHAGLHVVRGRPDFALESGMCACGISTPRLAMAAPARVFQPALA